jgi:ATP/maltotriose-dependent transcriptional regulator MalT
MDEAWRVEMQERLTPRQLEVLTLAADGLTDRQIAERLGISAATARTHMERIRSALRVDNRKDAVRVARELGLLR